MADAAGSANLPRGRSAVAEATSTGCAVQKPTDSRFRFAEEVADCAGQRLCQRFSFTLPAERWQGARLGLIALARGRRIVGSDRVRRYC